MNKRQLIKIAAIVLAGLVIILLITYFGHDRNPFQTLRNLGNSTISTLPQWSPTSTLPDGTSIGNAVLPRSNRNVLIAESLYLFDTQDGCLQTDGNGLVSSSGSACGTGSGGGGSSNWTYTSNKDLLTTATATSDVLIGGSATTTAASLEVIGLTFLPDLRSTVTNATSSLIDTLTLGNALVVGSGGTGVATLLDHGVLVGSGTGAVTALTVGTNGQLLVGSTGADPVFATLNCADNLTCTTGAGTLELDVDDSFILNTGDTGTGLYVLPDLRAATFNSTSSLIDTLLVGTAANPRTDNGAALGSTSLKWADLFLASGGVINWNTGNYTLTHAAGSLTVGGGLFVSPDTRASVLNSTTTLIDNLTANTTLRLPLNGTVTTEGRIGFNTTSDNFVIATSTGAELPVVIGSATTTLYSFTVASTSPDFLSGGIIDLPAHPLRQVVTQVLCHVDAGTSQQIFISDGTNDTNTLTCTTTRNQYSITSNGVFTPYEAIRLEFATKAGSPDYLVVRVMGYRTSD